MISIFLQLLLLCNHSNSLTTSNLVLSNEFNSDKIILDSDVSFEQAIANSEIPPEIIEQLTLIHVKYFGFDSRMHIGQLLTNKSCADELYEIFAELYSLKFPIQMVKPISEFGWSDETSMIANNTSSFNYRKIHGTGYNSLHSIGLAIDINPVQNPQMKQGRAIPSNATYNLTSPGTFLKFSKAVNGFKKKGWRWGGDWANNKDYQHFEK